MSHFMAVSLRGARAGRRVASLALRVISLALALLLSLPAAPLRAAEAPTPLAPLAGDTITPTEATPLAIPEFRWTPVAGATKYRLQISRDNFATLPVNITTANAAHTPVDAAPFVDGEWAWRVRVEAPSPVSDWSATSYFTKQWKDGTNVPALLFPEGDETLAFFDSSSFSWTPVLGAASYRLEIAAADAGFAAAKTYTTLNTTLQPVAKLPDGDYDWRVVPLDRSGREGMPSKTRRFKVRYIYAPEQLSPPDDSFPIFTPTFAWEAVPGAQYYTLQYSSDPTFSSGVNGITTRNTAYTPGDDLPNDVNFYWRVRVYSGGSVGPWSKPSGEEWSFLKRWYLPPVLLTPTNGFQHVDKPFFSWTPVPGARRYKFEISPVISFASDTYSGVTANPFFHVPMGKKPLDPGTTWYWRVTPLDANNNAGMTSAVFSFRTSALPAPMLISPPFYYPPNAYGEGTEMDPHEDRTVPLPIFAWTRVVAGDEQAVAYRVEVSTDDAVNPDGTLAAVVWSAETESLFATPTEANPFAPAEGTDYYWHVAVLDGLGGNVVGPWSEIWLARLAPSALLTPSAPGTTPQLLRPEQGSEWTEATPLLEWRPVAGADAYDVEISTDPGYDPAYLAVAARVPYPAYSPSARLTYDGDGLAALPYGTYYWRVRAVAGGVAGNWNVPMPTDGQPARFQVAAQSRWHEVADPANRVLIATDPPGDTADAAYDLTTLYAAQTKDHWHFGFHVAAGAAANYVLYLDLNHKANSGGTTDPLGYPVVTMEAHRPEYVIQIGNDGAAPVATQTWIYRWTDSSWATRQNLATLGGTLSYVAGYLELTVPHTAIGMEERTHSAALALYSAPATGGPVQDTVPPAANLTVLSRFASVTDRLMLASPANLNRVASEGVRYPSVPPFRWHPPVGVACYGYGVQVALDALFTTPVLDFSYRTKNAPGFEPPFLPYFKDLNGDNTYYWRVRPYYSGTGDYLGAWSEAFVLERDGFVPQNLRPSVTFATPTFDWDRVEGASGYDLLVSTTDLFGSVVIDAPDMARNTYTGESTLPDGTYYWRVRARRDGGIFNDWSAPEVLTLAAPRPGNLVALPSETPSYAPTLCWDPVFKSAGGTPVLAAWKYRVQVSRDGFATIWDTVDTEQPCWTPTKGYLDGAYSWRVAMIDGQGRLGGYSDSATFTKTYPTPIQVSPVHRSICHTTPTLVWQPVFGAARYKVEVGTDARFGVLYDSVITDNARWTPTKAYTPGVTFWWRVTMIDKDGRAGLPPALPEEHTFIVDPSVPLDNPVFLPRISVR